MKKVVLAYSGGLDTSIIAKWLQDTYSCEVVTFTADIGQGEEVEPARLKAEAMGIKEIYIEDLREEFARDFVFPMFRANAIYEGEYLLGTSIARPLISKRLVEIAGEVGADAISHGATGKGNDQVRFELNAYAINSEIQIIAPWREWDLSSRESLMDYAEKHNIEVDYKKQSKKSPYSMDANLLHISYEGDLLEDPWQEAEEEMWRWTVSPENAPDKPEYIEITYEKGDITAINGESMSPAKVMEKLNQIAGSHGIGRLDIVENRFVGMKSRGCYETPAGTIMLKAHRAIESLTLDREAAHLKDELMPKYAKLIYNGFWFAPEREMMQAAIDASQENVSGVVRVKLYKGNTSVVGRKSDNSLFSEKIATFEDDGGAYNQKDAEGFIKLNALRLRLKSPIVIKVGILSDTHGVIHPEIIKLMNDCDFVIHAGDIVDEDSLAVLTPKQKMIAVKGNNDLHINSLGEFEMLNLPGGNIAIEHGHMHGHIQPSHDSLREAYPNAKVVVYGHTHKQVIDKEGPTWVVNPGSAGKTRNYGAAKCLKLTIKSDHEWDIEPQIFDDVF